VDQTEKRRSLNHLHKTVSRIRWTDRVWQHPQKCSRMLLRLEGRTDCASQLCAFGKRHTRKEKGAYAAQLENRPTILLEFEDRFGTKQSATETTRKQLNAAPKCKGFSTLEKGKKKKKKNNGGGILCSTVLRVLMARTAG